MVREAGGKLQEVLRNWLGYVHDGEPRGWQNKQRPEHQGLSLVSVKVVFFPTGNGKE